MFPVTRVMVCSFHQILLGRAGKDYSCPKYAYICVCGGGTRAGNTKMKEYFSRELQREKVTWRPKCGWEANLTFIARQF